MANNYEFLDDMLKRKYSNKKNVKPVKAKKVKNKTKMGKTRVIAMVLAIVLAASSGIVGITHLFKKKNKDVPKTPDTSVSTVADIPTVDLSDMGIELDFPKETTNNIEIVSGNVDPNKVVEKNDKLYVNQENADKSNQVGNVKVDTKNDTLKVESDGTVKEKTEGYEIKDDEGNVVDKSELDNSGIPDGYAWDSVLNKYLPKEEVGKYVYADATYYDEEGNAILDKGDVVLKETLEKAKKYFSTTKPTVKNTTTTTSTPVPETTTPKEEVVEEETVVVTEEGIVNKDGTYSIYGMTFETKADYEQWVLQGYEGYSEADGIMKSDEEIQKQLQKTK